MGERRRPGAALPEDGGAAAVEDAEAVARQVKELQEQWRQVSDVPRQQGDALWRRFKAAHDVAWNRCAAYFAEQAEVRAPTWRRKSHSANRPRRSGLERLDPDCRSHQIAAGRVEGRRARVARTGKSHLGALPRRLRPVFHPPAGDLVERKATWTANLAKKEALCARSRRSPIQPSGRPPRPRSSGCRPSGRQSGP